MELPDLDRLAAPAAPAPHEPSLPERLATADAGASMVAVWTVGDDGRLEYTCHRNDFPVARLREAAEKCLDDQQGEILRCLVREAVRAELTR